MPQCDLAQLAQLAEEERESFHVAALASQIRQREMRRVVSEERALSDAAMRRRAASRDRCAQQDKDKVQGGRGWAKSCREARFVEETQFLPGVSANSNNKALLIFEKDQLAQCVPFPRLGQCCPDWDPECCVRDGGNCIDIQDSVKMRAQSVKRMIDEGTKTRSG